MAPPRKKDFSLHKELSPLFQSNSFSPDSAFSLTQLSPRTKTPSLRACARLHIQKESSQLLSLAVSHIAVSLKLQPPPSSATSTSLRTKTQFFRRRFRLVIERGLQALRVHPFFSRSFNEILTATYASPHCKKDSLTSQTLSTSTT